jgi:hypothetical protein
VSCRVVVVRLASGNVIWGLLPTERHFTAYLGLWLERGIHSLLTATLSRSGSGAAAPTGLLPPLLPPPPQGAPHTCVTGPAGISITTSATRPLPSGLAPGRRASCNRRQEDNWQTAPPNDLTAFCWISVVFCTLHWSALSLTLAECPFLFQQWTRYTRSDATAMQRAQRLANVCLSGSTFSTLA